MIRPILSFVWLQIAWFACVLGPVRGVPWVGPVVVLVGLVLHMRKREAKGREILFLAAATLLGFAVDTTLLHLGTLVIAGATVSPLWLVSLWPNFAAASASGGSLHALTRRPALGALLGALGGPSAYAGGVKLGALALGAPSSTSLVTIGVVWAIVVPALFTIRRRLDEALIPRVGT